MQTTPSLIAQGRQARRENRLEDAKGKFRAALAVARNNEERAQATTCVGQIERDRGNVTVARQLYREAADLYRAQGNSDRLAHTVRHIADMDRVAGDLSAAEPGYREALAIYRSLAGTASLDLANLLNGLSALLAAKGEREEATALTHEARQLYEAEDIEAGVSDCDERLGALK